MNEKLIERLRGATSQVIGHGNPRPIKLCNEAAEEIENLESQLKVKIEALAHCRKMAVDVIFEERHQKAKLREALQHVWEMGIPKDSVAVVREALEKSNG